MSITDYPSAPWDKPQPPRQSRRTRVALIAAGAVLAVGASAAVGASLSNGGGNQPTPAAASSPSTSATPPASRSQRQADELAANVKSQLQAAFDRDGTGETNDTVTCIPAGGAFFDCFSTNTTRYGGSDPASARYVVTDRGAFSYAGPTSQGSPSSGSYSNGGAYGS